MRCRSGPAAEEASTTRRASKPRHRPVSKRRSRLRRPARRRSTRRFAGGAGRNYVRLEVDLVHEAFLRGGLPFVRRLESVFREREVVEVEGLLRIAAGVLHALSSQGFSRVDHWEIRPGGWLPLPEPAHERLVEPVGHLLNALESDSWKRVAQARSFSVRLSGSGDLRADVTVRRVHRERGHAITLELLGPTSDRDLAGVERELRNHLAVARVQRTGVPRHRHGLRTHLPA